MKKCFYALCALVLYTPVHADIFDSFGLLKGNSTLNVAIGSDTTNQDISRLKTELEMLQKNDRAITEDLLVQSEKVKHQITAIESGKYENSEYVTRLVVALKSINQSVAALRTLRKEWITTVKQRLTLLESSSHNHDITTLLSERKTIYTIEDIQILGNQIAGQEEKVFHESARKKEAIIDIENLTKKITVAEKNYKDKIKEQADFNKEVKKEDRHVRVKGDLLDAEVSLALYEKEVATLRVKEKESKLALIVDSLSVEERTLQVLKQKLDFIVRIALRVDLDDVKEAQEKFKKEKQQCVTLTESYLQGIEKVTIQAEKIRRELSLLEKSYGEPGKEIQDITEWIATLSTVEGYLVLSELGLKNDEMLVLEREIDVLHGKIEFEKTKCREQELLADMVLSWHKIKHQKFKTSNDLLTEVKKYQDLAAELVREKSIYDDRRITATNKLTLQNHALSNLKNHKDTFKEKIKTITREDKEALVRIFDHLDKAQILINKQIDLTGALIELYSKSLVSIGISLKHIDAMIIELQRVSLWHRSRGAISWSGIKQAFPDIQHFFSDLKALTVHSFVSDFELSETINDLLDHPLQTFYLFLNLLYALALFIALLYGLPRISKQLLSVQRDYKGIYIMGKLSGFIGTFIYEHLISLFPWSILLYYFSYSTSAQLYTSMLFYLLSIPYLLYLSTRIVRDFSAFNTLHNYTILTESFQPRFILVMRWFLYATVIILLFRESFLLGGYGKSELPNILLALYSIIIRGLLLALIRKEDLLTIIPSRTPFWAWVWNIVNDYYYLLMGLFIVVMIISDTHIGGYDNLMTYIFWGILGTAVVIKGLSVFYGFFRRTSVLLFFSSEREVFKERFYMAKTLYSFLAIFLLIFFVFLGVWLIAWFWQKPLSLSGLTDFFTEKDLAIGFKDGQHQKLSILDVLRTFAFVPLSFIVASIVDKFILYRLFGMLLVDPGVHNTVSTISYYITVITVITLGLLHEGFGFLVVYYLGPILLGMVFALRDVFNDFVAYFIILLQRPLKVGDFIKINDEILGVVRRITPRSVVLRRNNSFSVIVPNSRIMTDVVSNWDYSRSFISFPDITVSVRYFEDPAQVRQLLLQAIESTDNILKTPAPVIRLDNFGVNGYVFLIRAFISSEKTLEQWDIASNVRFSIVKNLRQNGIELSFPIQIVHLKQDNSSQKN